MDTRGLRRVRVDGLVDVGGVGLANLSDLGSARGCLVVRPVNAEVGVNLVRHASSHRVGKRRAADRERQITLAAALRLFLPSEII